MGMKPRTIEERARRRVARFARGKDAAHCNSVAGFIKMGTTTPWDDAVADAWEAEAKAKSGRDWTP